MNGLVVTGSDFVPLDADTFLWVQMTRFDLIDGDDRSALEALIGSPGYAHDYASPFPSTHNSLEPHVHGRWRLSAISVDRFEPTTADAAVRRIQEWVDSPEWIDPEYRQPREVHGRLERIYHLLRNGSVYAMTNPGDDDVHDYGFVTGTYGFHEFVVIDRATAAVHVIVASDD